MRPRRRQEFNRISTIPLCSGRTSRVQIITLTYNAENRLTQMVSDTLTAGYVYDGTATVCGA